MKTFDECKCGIAKKTNDTRLTFCVTDAWDRTTGWINAVKEIRLDHLLSPGYVRVHVKDVYPDAIMIMIKKW